MNGDPMLVIYTGAKTESFSSGIYSGVREIGNLHHKFC